MTGTAQLFSPAVRRCALRRVSHVVVSKITDGKKLDLTAGVAGLAIVQFEHATALFSGNSPEDATPRGDAPRPAAVAKKSKQQKVG